MEIQITPYFLVLLERSTQFNNLEGFSEGHVIFIDKLIEAEKIRYGGDLIAHSQKSRSIFTDFDSAYLLNVRTLNEALKISQKDPFVKNKVYKPTVVQWNLIDE